jgi:hypothetical protein
MFNYPKLLSASAAFLLAACSSSAQASDSLAGTEWTGHYDLGPVTLRFQDDSKVSMIDSSGQVTGTYARKDDSVSIMAVQGDIRLVCQGKIQGQSMSGIAVTNRGARMKFQLTQVNKPAGANPGANPAPQGDNPPPQRNAPTAQAAPIGAGAKDVILQKIKVHDATARCDAFTLLVPEGWKTTGGVTWNLRKWGIADLLLKVNDPQSLRQLETLPRLPFLWMSGPVFGNMGREVTRQQPIMDPKAFVEAIVIPRFRKGARVTSVQMLPAVAKIWASQNIAGSVAAARVRLEYSIDQQPVEEDLYMVLSATPIIVGQTNWGAESIFALRSAKGKLDADSALLLPMALSLRPELQWIADYYRALQACDAVVANNTEQARQLTQIFAQTHAEISDMVRTKQADRQRMVDKTNLEFSKIIRGVEDYKSPTGSGTLTLPSGFSQVWSNGLDQYVLSNNPFVSDRLKGASWQRLQVAP